MKIEKVILNFENLESVAILEKNIDFLSFKEPANTYSGANLNEELIISKFSVSEYFAITLLPEANNSTFAKFHFDESYSPFERLQKFNDISSVEIYYDSGAKAEFYLEWKDTEGEINSMNNMYQSSEIWGGKLMVIVKK